MLDLTDIVELKTISTRDPEWTVQNDEFVEFPSTVDKVNQHIAEGWKLLGISFKEDEAHTSFIDYYLLGRFAPSEMDE